MATVRELTRWEVEEFIEEVVARPVLWFGKGMLWVRRKDGEHQFAVKFVPRSESEMCTVLVKVLNEQGVEEIDRYVEWLLTRLTSYGERKRIEYYLSSRLFGWDEGGPDTIEEMARDICRPISTGEIAPTSPPSPLVCPTESETQAQSPQAATPPVVVKRSRYLENLLRKKKD